MNDIIRRKKLIKLVEQYGGQSAFGKKTSISPSYINHIINGRRNLGPSLCRKIEEKLGLERGWLE